MILDNRRRIERLDKSCACLNNTNSYRGNDDDDYVIHELRESNNKLH